MLVLRLTPTVSGLFPQIRGCAVFMTEQHVSAVLAAGGDLLTPSHTDEFGEGEQDPSKSPVRDHELATLMDVDVQTLQLPPETEIYEAALTLGNMNLAAAASPGPLAAGPREEGPTTVVLDSDRMPPPPAREEARSSLTTLTGYRPVILDSDSDEETQDDFNAKWPVRFTEKCRVKSANGKLPVVDPGTCAGITRHMTNDECATLPAGCFDTFVKLYSCIQTHRALRMGVYKAGMELEKEAIRQRSRLSESESESEYVTSTWWKETKYMVQVVAKTLARAEEAKAKATVPKTSRLLTTAEFKTSETAIQEAEAAKEDVRIANENKRIAAEKADKETQKKPSKSLIDDTEDELDTTLMRKRRD